MDKAAVATSDSARRLLVLDNETPWITSLLNEMPAPWTNDRIGARSCGVSPWAWHRARRSGFVPIPGWTRAYGISTMLFERAVRNRISTTRQPQAVVHTIPWTAGLTLRIPELAHVYRPHDFFGMYDWNRARVIECERQFMTNCRVVVPMSDEHAGDLRQLGSAPVVTVANGVSNEFIHRLRATATARPYDLPNDGKFIVGCVGQINYTYDWDLIAELSDLIATAWIVFIGPKLAEPPEKQKRIDEVLSRHNVRWLGAKPHQQLPDYLHYFDACFSPLRVSPANDRRSLLRLFDYLAAEKVVVSTAVAAAKSHQGHVLHAESAHGIAQLIIEAMAGDHLVDVPARQAYVDEQTWAKRGQKLTSLVDRYCLIT